MAKGTKKGKGQQQQAQPAVIQQPMPVQTIQQEIPQAVTIPPPSQSTAAKKDEEVMKTGEEKKDERRLAAANAQKGTRGLRVEVSGLSIPE